MNVEVFDFKDYRSFLQAHLDASPKKGHGLRSVWALAMNCQVAYVSHVLNGLYEFSPEQAEALSRHLALNDEESEYFLLLVQMARAGTSSLKQFYRRQLKAKNSERENVRNRMKIRENLTLEDQAIYYSHWLYAAVHILLTIPEYQRSADAISNYFETPLGKIRDILNFLELRGLVEMQNGSYKVTANYLFIGRDSPLFPNQQSFWRQKAVESIYRNRPEDIHFASLFTISEVDLEKVRAILLSSIEKSTAIIKPSKEEKLVSICLDMFEVS